jgi:hypothetical protein
MDSYRGDRKMIVVLSAVGAALGRARLPAVRGGEASRVGALSHQGSFG